MIAIANYGLGNVQAIANIYRRLGIDATIASTPAELRAADRLILPGVGAFDWCMKRLNESGLRATLNELVLTAQVPVLGICVGMQVMARRSDEGVLDGLGWIDAEVKRLDRLAGAEHTRLPHMGWNDVRPVAGARVFGPDATPGRFYFLHSYFFAPAHQGDATAFTSYGAEFASSVSRGNVHGVQFHPEKSHEWGIQLLKRFAEL